MWKKLLFGCEARSIYYDYYDYKMIVFVLLSLQFGGGLTSANLSFKRRAHEQWPIQQKALE